MNQIQKKFFFNISQLYNFLSGLLHCYLFLFNIVFSFVEVLINGTDAQRLYGPYQVSSILGANLLYNSLSIWLY